MNASVNGRPGSTLILSQFPELFSPIGGKRQRDGFPLSAEPRDRNRCLCSKFHYY